MGRVFHFNHEGIVMRNVPVQRANQEGIMNQIAITILISLLIPVAALADDLNPQPLPPVAVSVDNFARAESDLYFSKNVKQTGLGKFQHIRTPAAVDNQMVIR